MIMLLSVGVITSVPVGGVMEPLANELPARPVAQETWTTPN